MRVLFSIFIFFIMIFTNTFPSLAEIKISKKGQEFIDTFKKQQPVICIEGREKHNDVYDTYCPTPGGFSLYKEAVKSVCQRGDLANTPICVAYFSGKSYRDATSRISFVSSLGGMQMRSKWRLAQDGRSILITSAVENVNARAEISPRDDLLYAYKLFLKAYGLDIDLEGYEVPSFDETKGFNIGESEKFFSPKLWVYLNFMGLDAPDADFKFVLNSENDGLLSSELLIPDLTYKQGAIKTFVFQLDKAKWEQLQKSSDLRMIENINEDGTTIELLRVSFSSEQLSENMDALLNSN